MDSSFEAHISTIEGRWQRALEAQGFEAAVIAAGQSANYYQDDHAPPFRANPDFAQWLPGDDTQGAYLLFRPGRKTELLLLSPKDYWHAPPSPPDWAEPSLGITTYETEDALEARVSAFVAEGGRTLLVSEQALSNLGCADHNTPAVMHSVRFERAVKTGWEVSQMRAASIVGAQGHIAAREAFANGASEFEINTAFLTASQQDAESLPYHSIVALNTHAGVLHYQHYDRKPPAERHSFLIDAGGRVNGFASDITRTYAAGDGAFAEMVSAFDQHQQRLIEAVQPGMSFVELHELAHRAVAETLVRFQCVQCSAESAFELGLTRTFLPHGLGHLLGIQTHDVGGQQKDASGTQEPPPAAYPALRMTRSIDVGQVFTIEPGLYFIPMLLDALRASPAGNEVHWPTVESFLPVGGIRIEDNVHVTPDGVENLTRNAFAEVELG